MEGCTIRQIKEKEMTEWTWRDWTIVQEENWEGALLEGWMIPREDRGAAGDKAFQEHLNTQPSALSRSCDQIKPITILLTMQLQMTAKDHFKPLVQF